jgi:hypothetical protein
MSGLATREEVFLALFAKLNTATLADGVTPAFVFSSRKLVLWADCPMEKRPAMYLTERETNYRSGPTGLSIRTLTALVFIYTNAKQADDSNSGSKILNPLVDAVQEVMKPNTYDGRLDLGGLVHTAYIDGDLFFDPGDIDGDGMAIIPIKILMP